MVICQICQLVLIAVLLCGSCLAQHSRKLGAKGSRGGYCKTHETDSTYSYKRSEDPFTLGVASGDPTSRSVVLWTRLAPDPLNGGGLEGNGPIRVHYKLASDELLNFPLETGSVLADEDESHSVHVKVGGLCSNTYYYYKFWVEGFESTVGRTKTLPDRRADMTELHMAYVSCSEYEFGYFAAYRHLADENLDFVIHLGDYIYETGNINSLLSPVRSTNGVEVKSAVEYRDRYALYKLDKDLQKVHAMHPFFVVWVSTRLQSLFSFSNARTGRPRNRQ